MKLPRNVFIDTSFFIALLNRDDVEYQRALTVQTQLTKQHVHKVTSEYILLELCDGLSRLRYRALAINLMDLFEQDDSFEVVPAGTEITQAAKTLFKSRPDKEWGLTDCTSFVIMHWYGIDTALSYDRHFKQAGFYTFP
jgi:hypothetical protein